MAAGSVEDLWKQEPQEGEEPEEKEAESKEAASKEGEQEGLRCMSVGLMAITNVSTLDSPLSSYLASVTLTVAVYPCPTSSIIICWQFCQRLQ